MPQISARFQKRDLYDHPVFICNEKCEQPSYEKLKKYYAKLKNSNYDTFLPIYHSEEFEYCTIRFKDINMILGKNNTYSINLTVKKHTRDDKTYVNGFVDTISILKVAENREGEVLDLDM